MTPPPHTAAAPTSPMGSASSLGSSTLALLSAQSLGGVHTVSLGLPVNQHDIQPCGSADNSPASSLEKSGGKRQDNAGTGVPTSPYVLTTRHLVLVTVIGILVLTTLMLYPRLETNNPHLVPQDIVQAPAVVIPVDPAPKTEAVTTVTTVETAYEESSAQAKVPVPSPLPIQLPIVPATTTVAKAKSGTGVQIDQKPEKVHTQKTEKSEKTERTENAGKAAPMLQEAEDKPSAVLAHAPQVTQADPKHKDAASGRLIAIAPDGQSAAFIESKTRTPVQVRAGSVLSNGEKVVTINGKTGILTTDKREYVLD